MPNTLDPVKKLVVMASVYTEEDTEFEDNNSLAKLIKHDLEKRGWLKLASKPDIDDMIRIIGEVSDELMAIADEVKVSMVICIKLMVSLMSCSESAQIDRLIDPVLMELHRRG